MKKFYCALFFLIAAHINIMAQAIWKPENVQHESESYLREIEIPKSNTVWASPSIYDSATFSYTSQNVFLRTVNGGVTWKYDSITAAGKSGDCILGSLSPIDNDTCYATIYNGADGTKSGLYKTKNGGNTWRQLEAGAVYSALSFPDFVYFWNSRQGITLGDGDKTGNFEIYTTSDGGSTWSRVPPSNLPAVSSNPYSFTNGYRVLGNRIWFYGVVANAYAVYRSDDFGLHWKSFPISFPFNSSNYWQSWTFTDSLHGYITGWLAYSHNYLYSTSDGGQTWNGPLNYTGPERDAVTAITNVPGTSIIVTAAYDGTAYSADSALTWVPLDNINHSGELKYYNFKVAWSSKYETLASDSGGIYKLASSGFPPEVKLTSPGPDSIIYKAPATIILSADAKDPDGKIKKVEFYSGDTLIGTEYNPPYYRNWNHVQGGYYSITAKAIDNDGLATVSDAVTIFVTPNKLPKVTITSPVNETSYIAPATIVLSANAKDPDGKIKKVEFYSDSILIGTEENPPYYRFWNHVHAGNYNVTAKATDNDGGVTTSSSVHIRVLANNSNGGVVPVMIAPSGLNNIDRKLEQVTLDLNPNPSNGILNINIEGQQPGSKSAISILSVSGVVIKTIPSNTLNKKVVLDVSSLTPGTYFIKFANGGKVVYKSFVKL